MFLNDKQNKMAFGSVKNYMYRKFNRIIILKGLFVYHFC